MSASMRFDPAFLFTFKGRFNRRLYWQYAMLVPMLMGGVVGLVVALSGAMMKTPDPADGQGSVGEVALGLFIIAAYLLILSISIPATVRRMHDLGRSGWWLLLGAVPLVGLGIFIWQGFIKGTEGPNEYGPDPLAVASRWIVVGVDGQYKDCEFPLSQRLVFGTDPRRCSVVIDARKHPEIEPAVCELSPSTGGKAPIVQWLDAEKGSGRRDRGFDGAELALCRGLRFQLRPVA